MDKKKMKMVLIGLSAFAVLISMTTFQFYSQVKFLEKQGEKLEGKQAELIDINKDLATRLKTALEKKEALLEQLGQMKESLNKTEEERTSYVEKYEKIQEERYALQKKIEELKDSQGDIQLSMVDKNLPKKGDIDPYWQQVFQEKAELEVRTKELMFKLQNKDRELDSLNSQKTNLEIELRKTRREAAALTSRSKFDKQTADILTKTFIKCYTMH